MTNLDDFWSESHELLEGSEADVEDRLIRPLVRALGWPDDELHPKVQLKKTGSKSRRGPGPIADFILAPRAPGPLQSAEVVIETKAPSAGLKDAFEQADSYASALNAPLFLITDGRTLEIWERRWLNPPQRMVCESVVDLPARRAKIEAIIARDIVRAQYADRTRSTPVSARRDLVRDYLDSLQQRIDDFEPLPRTIVEEPNDKYKISAQPEEGIVPVDGETWLLSGYSGRGKSTVLRMLERKALATSHRGPVPFHLDSGSLQGDVIDALVQSLGRQMPAFHSAVGLLEWLRQTPSLLLIDDWHKGDARARSAIERFLRDVRPHAMAVVFASAPGSAAPNGVRLRRFMLPRYSIEERDEAISHFMDPSKRVSSWRIIGKVSEGFGELLREPVILDRFLKLIDWKPRGGLRLPSDLPRMMDALLEKLLESRRVDARSFADAVSAVCVQIVTRSERFSLVDVADAVRAADIDVKSPAFADDLVASGVWSRKGAGYFQFEHEIWRRHFQARALRESRRWDSKKGIQEWVASEDAAPLFALVPFAVSLIERPEDREALHNALLQRDLGLYLRGLAASPRSPATNAGPACEVTCLQRLRDGYVDVIERWFPQLKPVLEPWVFAEDLSPNMKVVVVGRALWHSLEYRFRLGTVDERDVDIEVPQWSKVSDEIDTTDSPLNAFPSDGLHKSGARQGDGDQIGDPACADTDIPNDDIVLSAESDEEWKVDIDGRSVPMLGLTISDENGTTRILNLAFDGTNPDAGRLVVAKLVLEEIARIFDVRTFFVPWIMKERFVDYFYRVPTDGPTNDWMTLSIGSILELAADALTNRIQRDDGVESAERPYAFRPWDEDDAAVLEELYGIGEWLKGQGLSTSTLRALMLPAPDPDESGGWHYSRDRIMERIHVLSCAVMSTYKEICETYFAEIRHEFFYAQCPCRAVVEVEFGGDPDDSAGFSGWAMCWQACERWDEGSVVRAVGRRSNFVEGKGYQEIDGNEQENCRRLGRKFVQTWVLSANSGSVLSNDAVTEGVLTILRWDLERLKRRLEIGP